MKKLFGKPQNNLIKRGISLTLAFSLMCMWSVSPEVSDELETFMLRAHAADVPILTYERLVSYSQEYSNDPSNHKYDNITIAIAGSGADATSASIYNYDDFIPLGGTGESDAFQGTLTVSTDAFDYLNLSKPLFSNIKDNVTINVNRNVNGTTTSGFSLELRRPETSGNVYTYPCVFAQNVWHDTDTTEANNWRITLAPFSETIGDETETNSPNFGGLIETIHDDALVNIELENNTTSGANTGNIVSTNGNAGLICGTLGEDAVLNVTLSGGNTTYNVTAATASTQTVTDIDENQITSYVNNYHAGGLIGEMLNGATLVPTLADGYTMTGTGRTVLAPCGYAGGIVGKANDPVFTYTSSYTLNETIEGYLGAGGIAGYYCTTSGNAFDLSNVTIDCNVKVIPIASEARPDGYSGGLFGVLETNGDFMIAGESNSSLLSFTSTVSNTSGAFYGGLIGLYKTNDLENTLSIKNVETITKNDSSAKGNFAGYIGKLDDTSAAYIEFDNVKCRNAITTENFDGLIRHAGNAGHFVNVKDFTLSGLLKSGTYETTSYAGSGLIGTIGAGVVRIEGETNFTYARNSKAQLVESRGNTLIYALGSGADSGWTFLRCANNKDVQHNDIGNWGEVVRITSENEYIPDYDLDTETISDPDTTSTSDGLIVTFNKTAHTVAVAEAKTAIDSDTDFIRTALNMQINQGDIGALQFDNDTNDSSTLLGTTLSISGEIDLRGTGILGLMRDDGKQNAAHALEPTDATPFTGSITGSSNANVILGIGEFYGMRGDTDLSTISDQRPQAGSGNYSAGTIYGHNYNGLLAITADTVNISDLKVSGNIYVNGVTTIGGYVAYCNGTLNISGANAAELIYNYSTDDTKYAVYVGGIVGRVNAGSGTVSISGSNTTSIETSKRSTTYVSNGIGYVDDCDTITFNNYTMTGTSTGTSATGYLKMTDFDTNPGVRGDDAVAGGLIAYIATATTNKHRVNIHKVKLDGYNMDISARRTAGGLLGYAWNNAEIDISPTTNNTSDFGLLIDDCEYTVSLHQSGNDKYNTADFAAGGLLYVATGYIGVTDITIIDTTFSGADLDSFGVLVNKGVYSSGSTSYALYLEFRKEGAYNLKTGNSVSDMTKLRTFDEVCAYSNFYSSETNIAITSPPSTQNKDTKPTSSNVIKNGNAIISFHTANGTIVNSNKSCATYQNQLTLPASDNLTDKGNKHTRYYYDLDVIRTAVRDNSYPSGMTAAKQGAYQLMMWSLNQYAHSSISSYFPTVADASFPTSVDLSDVSYYPVNRDTAFTLANATTIKFNNEAIENAETDTGLASGATAGNTDIYNRSTVNSNSQHNLMHCGLFYNVTGNISFEADLTLQGNIGRHSNGSGVLVANMLGNLSSGSTALNNGDKSIILDGIYVSSSSATKPLLINKIGSRVDLDLNGVNTNSDSYNSLITAENYAASSLIGTAGTTDKDGNPTSTAIDLLFTNIRLDARQATYSPDDTAATALLNSKYGTSRTIFSCATLLDSFIYSDTDNTNTGTYNYPWTSDWSNATTPIHNVTYGYEITGSLDYDGKQEHYIDRTTNPYFISPESGKLESSEYGHFDNFIPYVYNRGQKNDNYHEIKVNHTATSILNGCGTYNDPYIISNGDELETLDKILRLQNVDSSFSINYPNSTTEANKYCENKAGHYVLTFNGTDTYIGTGGNKTKAALATYLAGAYYKIPANATIDIDDLGYAGLGAGAENEVTAEAYAFRGVIVGDKDNPPTIINESKSPFIQTSTGSVVKDIKIQSAYNGTIELIQGTVGTDAKFTYYGGCQSYGAVIGKVMGGDNIIDGVDVTFGNNTKISLTGAGAQLVPVGGYVGVVRGGALIFRGMGSVTHKSGIASANIENTFSSKNAVAADCDAYLYVNPIVGRVLDAYVVNESDAYRYSEDGSRGTAAAVTMKNNRKNYSIADIKKPSLTEAQQSLTDAQKTTILDSQKLDVSALQPAGSYRKQTITFPDAQSLFILSLLTQTKMTTSYYQDGFIYMYNIDNTSTPCYGGQQYTRMAQYSNVGNISSDDDDDFELSLDDTTDVKGDNLVPYIIANYTTKKGDEHTGYAVFNVTNYSVQSNFVFGGNGNETWYLPDGFRGLGSLWYGNATDIALNSKKGNANMLNDSNINLYGFNANSDTLSLNMTYKCYEKNFENYPSFKDTGFGLFNSLNMNTKSRVDDSGTYTLSGDNKSYYTMKNLTIDGNVSVDVITHSTGLTITGANQYNTVNQDMYIAAGGLVGATATTRGNNKYILENVDIGTLTVSGVKHAGGLLGYGSWSSVEAYSQFIINDCDITNLSVSSSRTTGGLIGYIEKCNVYVNDPTSASVTINSAMSAGGMIGYTATSGSVTVNGDTNGSGTNKQYLITSVNMTSNNAGDSLYAGGLIGYTAVTANIRNIDIGKYNDSYSGFIGNSDRSLDSATETTLLNGKTGKKPASKVGGVIGYASNPPAIAKTNVYNQHLYGGHVGGIIGYLTDNIVYTISNCTIKSTDENRLISGWRNVGGVVGYCIHKTADGNNSNTHFKIDNCMVDSYTIREYNYFDNGMACGGLIGKLDNGYSILNLHDSAIQNCKIEGQGGQDYNATNGVGGLIGVCNGCLFSYNILIDDIQLLATSNTTPTILDYQKIATRNKTNYGYIYGGYNSDYTCVRIAGLSIHNSNSNDCMDKPWRVDATGTKNEKNVNHSIRYIIYSDNLNKSIEEEAGSFPYCSTTFSSFNSNNNVDLTIRTDAPFVTSSPFIKMGQPETAFLTGDGMYTNYSVSEAAKTDLAENASFTANIALYSKFKNSDGVTANDDGKVYPKIFSSYYSELSSLPTGVQDFPVLVLEKQDSDLNALINSYVRLLTKSAYIDLTTNQSSVYDVVISRCLYNDSEHRFKIDTNTDNMGLTRSNNTFRVNTSNPDTGTVDPETNEVLNRFTLIDIQFKDPSGSGKVAYHLYIPVLVKRLIQYDFYAASQPGSNYDSSLYFPYWGNLNLGNLGSPMTVYFRYKYKVTADDWQNSINSGEDLRWYFEKSLQFRASEYNLPSGTRFALIDTNDKDKVYYATYLTSDETPVMSSTGKAANYVLNLNTFKSESNQLFKSQSICDRIAPYVTATEFTGDSDSEIKLYVEDNSNYTVKAMLNGAEKKFRPVTDSGDEAKTKYVLNVDTSNNATWWENLMQESYYLSIFTDLDGGDHNLRIMHIGAYGCRSTATDVSHPTKNNSNRETAIMLGEIFVQNFIVENEQNGYNTDAVNTNSPVGLINESQYYFDSTVSVNIKLNPSSAGSIVSYIADRDNLNIYHTFLATLTKTSDDGTETKIYGTPSFTAGIGSENPKYGYIYSSISNSQAENSYAGSYEASVPVVVNGSYIKVGDSDFNIKPFLTEGIDTDNDSLIDAYGEANIVVKFRTTYSNPLDWPKQFGSRLENSTITTNGTTVSFSSLLDTSYETINYSAMRKVHADDTKFFTWQSSSAKITYNIVKEYDDIAQSNTYNQLGINPRDNEAEFNNLITADGCYDATDFTDSINANWIRWELVLDQKNASDGYTTVNMDDYLLNLSATNTNKVVAYRTDNPDLDNLFIFKKATRTTDSGSYTYYYFEEPYTGQLDYMYLTTMIRFKTDDDLEALGESGIYANYKLKLSASLYTVEQADLSDDEIVDKSTVGAYVNNSERKPDYIIYTNAKVEPSFVKP